VLRLIGEFDDLREHLRRSQHLDALVELLTDDVFISMPPMPFEYQCRNVVARFFAAFFDTGRRVDLVRTRANGQPAFGVYLQSSSGIRHGYGVYVLTLSCGRISAMTRFENDVLASFGLPQSLAGA
jgi:hypothetical protein